MTKYHGIRDQLLERIDSMAAGEQLPSERELAAELGVARMTLRRAIDELVVRGAVRRRHGSGVFALGPKLDQGLAASSFTRDMQARGLRPGARTLSFDTGPAGTLAARRLDLAPDTALIRLTRLRLADDEPIALEQLHVPAELVPGLSRGDLEDRSFYTLLAQRYSVTLAKAVQTIEPTVLDAQESRDLAVPEHTPALHFERTSWDADGRAVEFVRSVYRGDRYKIRTELALPGPEQEAP
ncbi:GntR family transcriptional regulator [Nesterenkonia sp. HG001]|uniref:GntR family transcriptional regulator n=1 Tax=Nesterenkonia sp. HG001 TaxID=2983207 RepID=UPI002AC71214|nr:GntR family transcriptional regulator [Nesterenkonia sp. HG001]MDZ5077996.1 GntR family transcriptional regulator [Nesterenkonia sp. HG001]